MSRSTSAIISLSSSATCLMILGKLGTNCLFDKMELTSFAKKRTIQWKTITVSDETLKHSNEVKFLEESLVRNSAGRAISNKSPQNLFMPLGLVGKLCCFGIESWFDRNFHLSNDRTTLAVMGTLATVGGVKGRLRKYHCEVYQK